MIPAARRRRDKTILSVAVIFTVSTWCAVLFAAALTILLHH